MNSPALAADDDFYLPFASFKNRKSCRELARRSLDGFGAYRRAGHKHAGLDIKANYGEPVFAIGKGQVVQIFADFPYRTVVVEHRLSTGETIYSAYIHVEDVLVDIGDEVDEATHIARVFDAGEHQRSRFYKNHLHFEIRKAQGNFKGVSVKCFTTEELNRNLYDPVVFFRKYLK